MKIDEFKKFVRNNPNLANYVIDKKMTWQQLYEIYDLYGENNSIWDNFKNKDITNSNNVVTTIKDFIGLIKGIDLNSVQKTLTSLSDIIETFKGFNNKDNGSSYEERPKYKYFED